MCITENCLDALCTSPSCARSRTLTIRGPDDGWVRYLHGSTYRYDEGLLSSVTTGKGGATLRTVTHAYDHGTTAQAYAAKRGTSPQQRGVGWVSEAVRPKISTVTTQDGADFIWSVEKGCWDPSAYCLDVFANPTRITRASTVAGPQQGPNIALPPSSVPVLAAPAQNATGAYTVTWSTSSGATSYDLQEQQGAAVWSALYSGGGTSHAVASRTTGEWRYRVRACNAAGCTGYSAVAVTQVAIPPAGPPTLSAPASNTSGTFSVSWQAVTHAVSYEVEESANGGAWYAVGTTGGLGVVVDGRPQGTYAYRARACNAVSCSAYSAMVSVVVNPAITQAPTLTIQVATGPTTTVNASWTGVAGASAYRLERNRNGGPWVTRYNGPNTAVSESFGMGGTFQYRVRGYAGSDSGPFSNTVTFHVPPSTSSDGESE